MNQLPYLNNLFLRQEALNGKDMVLECHLLDSRGFKLASAIRGVSPPWSKHSITIEPVFKHPVRVERNTIYSIKVSISNHRPQFLLGTYFCNLI